MSNTTLPKAVQSKEEFKFGSIIIKQELPTETITNFKKALKDLEKAAKDKVFIVNEPAAE